MKKDKHVGLMAQINIIFTIVAAITSILFVLIFRQTLDSLSKNQADRDFVYFSKELAKTKKDLIVINEYYSYIVYQVGNDYDDLMLYRDMTKDNLLIDSIESFKQRYSSYIVNNEESNMILKHEGLKYYFTKVNEENEKFIIITISDGSFEKSLKEPVNNIVLIGFLSLIILGNAIILLWSSLTVERIKKLTVEISNLSDTAYKTPIVIEGHDEITDLMNVVETMREEIVSNEETKQEMLQNLSHDIKTPISVIKSYAEAIKDGISDLNDIDVIIRQTDVLTSKVVKLLEWNRLEYIQEKESYYPVDIKRIITSIANNYKYKKNISFKLDLDNSYLIGLDDHYYSMIGNIVENAIRYAKTTIKITLKNKKITIFNDGDPIDNKFLNNDFRPYQKGHKGQFGLGLSIVSKTAELFELKVEVLNVDGGVSFIIEPL